MNTRDELIELILPILEECFDSDWNMTYSEMVTDAVLAAGYRKPRTITTPEELDSLPDRTVVMTAAGSIVNIVGDRAYIFGYESSAPRWTLSLPATVLHEPAVTP